MVSTPSPPPDTGLANGTLQMLSLDRLMVTKSFRNTTFAITDIRFSDDSVFLAVADANYCVAVYRYSDLEDTEDDENWVYLGKHRAHTAPITGRLGCFYGLGRARHRVAFHWLSQPIRALF